MLPIKEDREDERRAAAAVLPDTEPRAGGAGSYAPPVADLPRETAAARPESFAARVSAARWSVVAGLCLFGAAACLLARRMDAAFVVATLGVVAWFWNERNRLRPRGIETDDRFRDEDEGFEDRDEE